MVTLVKHRNFVRKAKKSGLIFYFLHRAGNKHPYVACEHTLSFLSDVDWPHQVSGPFTKEQLTAYEGITNTWPAGYVCDKCNMDDIVDVESRLR